MLLAFGGIITSLTVICLLICSVFGFNTMALLSLSSFFVGTMFIESGYKNALLCYFSASLLSFILPIDKMISLAFILFFGYYPILKALIEKINKIYLETVVKAVFFLIIAFAVVFGYKELFLKNISDVLPLWAVILAAIIFLGIYDYALSILFDYYTKRIRPKIKSRY